MDETLQSLDIDGGAIGCDSVVVVSPTNEPHHEVLAGTGGGGGGGGGEGDRAVLTAVAAAFEGELIAAWLDLGFLSGSAAQGKGVISALAGE